MAIMSALSELAVLPCDLLSAAVRWAFTDGGFVFFDDDKIEIWDAAAWRQER